MSREIDIERNCTLAELHNLRMLKYLLEQSPPDIIKALERIKYHTELLEQFLQETEPPNNPDIYPNNE